MNVIFCLLLETFTSMYDRINLSVQVYLFKFPLNRVHTADYIWQLLYMLRAPQNQPVLICKNNKLSQSLYYNMHHVSTI